jgi:hypothetical protein
VCSNFDSCAILNSQAPKIFCLQNNVDFLGNSEVAFFFIHPVYHNLLHFCLTLTQLGFIFSVAILYPEILKAFVALGASFDFGLGGFFSFGGPQPLSAALIINYCFELIYAVQIV